ncbi:MAG: FadR/GntR family transcriptional regulator [Eubacteriales bacterium]
MLEPLKKTRLFEDIINQLLGLIINGSLKPGDRLPSERQLAEELQVSRTALREALRSMESLGYLDSKVGGGTFIRSVTLDNVISPFSVVLSQDEKLIGELISVRELLETEIASLAAKNITPEYALRIRQSLENMKAEIKSGETGLNGDNEFHNLLAEIAKNGALSLICELCSELLSKSRLATLSLPNQPAKTLEDHTRIANAVIEGSSVNASKLMRQHLRKAQQNLERATLEKSLKKH